MSSAAAQQLISVDEFLVWGEGREGRWELRDGVVVSMAPERIGHTRVKGAAFNALGAAIRAAGLPCEAFVDGVTVRISKTTAFKPDAVVVCGAALDDEALEAQNPIIIVEVLSPSTEAYDRGEKVGGYFSLPSVMHYLILDPERKNLVHYRRGSGEYLETRFLAAGPLRLDPPGLELAIESLFER